jgi:hypothetical protein
MTIIEISILSGMMVMLCIVMSIGIYIFNDGSISTQAVVYQPTYMPSPTAIVPTWKDRPLVDKPFQAIFPNETPSDKRLEIYGSGVVLNTDTRWVIDTQVDKLGQDVSEANTGIILRGYNENGNIQNFQLVYQSGNWAIGYSPNSSDNSLTYWEVFQSLKSPVQHFELLITSDGRSVTLKNDNGFQVSRIVDGKFFDGAQIIITEAQIGPQTKITFLRLVVQQLQIEQVANFPNLPSGFLTPTAMASTSNEPEYVFHVAANGNDTNSGTAENPFASIEHARDVIRTLNSTMKGSIVVYVHGGVYPVSETIQFGAIDSGQNGYDIIYRAAEGENPVFSGGITVNGWQKVPDSLLWKTTLTDVKGFRQMYVNGVRAQRAASQEPVTGLDWAAGDISDRDGIVISPSKLPDLSRPQDLELHWIYDWKDMRLLVKSIENNPDGTKTILMKQPYFSYALWMEQDDSHQWFPKYDVPFYLENAFELLDEPGEWYYNPDTHELFYLPRQDEDMNSAEVIIPQTQNLIEITGEAVGREVHNIAFEGLTFAYAGWTRASEMGTFGWQAQDLIIKAGWDNYYQTMTPAHVQVNSAHDIRFESCRFEHLGAVGLDLNNNVYQTIVQGNLFHDISDAAIVVGHWEHAYITAPSFQAAPHDNLIANNLIQNVGVEYWGAPAITAYYVNNLQIIHNEISNVPYTGISVGWGWSSNTNSTTSHDNHVTNNLITDVLQRARDGGGIYTLGQQPGTTIEANVIRRVKGDQACLYPDEGSAFITLKNNVCDSAPKWLDIWIASIHDLQILNSFTNVEATRNNGVNIQIENTVYIDEQEWTPEAQSIIDNAGLEPAYSYLRGWLNGE